MRLCLLGLLAALAVPASAQINAERMRRALATDGVQLAVDASAAFASGNTDYFQLGVGGRADWRRGADLLFTVSEFEFSTADEEVFVDQGFLHTRYNHDASRRLAYEAFGQVERNSQQLLDTRALLGAGLRVRLADAEKVGVALGTTPMFEYERLAEEAHEEDASVVRWSSYASVRAALSGTAALTGVVYAQPKLGDVGDIRYLTQATLELKVTRWLRVQVQGNLRHDTRPPASVERTDFSLENGFVFLIPAM